MTARATTRRAFLANCAATAAIAAKAQEPGSLPAARALTRGPKFHWFGYYDKLEFDPSGRYVLGMEVNFEHRSPQAEDRISIGMADTRGGDAWKEIGTSAAWSWQQGCMLQWRPGSSKEILWNDRDGDRFVCRIFDTSTGKLRTIPKAIYTIAPDGATAITCDFRRLNDVRPGYGYAGIPDPAKDELLPKESGIWSVDLERGSEALLFSVADIAKFGEPPPDAKGAKHWFNHLLFSPDGSRFVFLHRWRPVGQNGFRTRMLSADRAGKDLTVVDPSGATSHFIWRDPETLLAWTRPAGRKDGFYLLHVRRGVFDQVGAGVMTENGHCTYLPDRNWILNDTYPDMRRLQHPYLFHVPTKARIPLGDFLSPKEYAGEWRCDTHPRFSPDGRTVVIDSPHGGNGRQLYAIEIGPILDRIGR
ncbi:MAG TPA: hypothetical protein VNC50_17090 [Planctomycetia bacterium]|nr:hypothetical protein [Planctomycetia bacterium]